MERSRRHEGNVIYGRVTDKGSGVPIRNAEVRLLTKPKSAIVGSAQEEGDERKKKPIAPPEDYTYHSKVLTDEDGRFRFAHLDASLTYKVDTEPFGIGDAQQGLTVADGEEKNVNLTPDLGLTLKTVTYHDDPAQPAGFPHPRDPFQRADAACSAARALCISKNTQSLWRRMPTSQVRSEDWPVKRSRALKAARKVSCTRSSATLASRTWPMAKLNRESPCASTQSSGLVDFGCVFSAVLAVLFIANAPIAAVVPRSRDPAKSHE